MFRRKEESLFDNTTDPNQESVESSSVSSPATPPSSAPAHSPASSSPAGASSYGHGNSGSGMPRPPGVTSPSQPSSSSFRPSTPASPLGDMSRNRMPEVGKPGSSSGILPAGGQPAASSDKGSKTGARRVLTVGNDILLKGEIATCDRLVIEGKVDATLNDVHTVEIAENGSFKGSANIEDAEISGLFEGDLIVRNRLIIYATGKVRGKITYGEIEIERGGELTGEIKTNASAAGATTRARATKDDKVAA